MTSVGKRSLTLTCDHDGACFHLQTPKNFQRHRSVVRPSCTDLRRRFFSKSKFIQRSGRTKSTGRGRGRWTLATICSAQRYSVHWLGALRDGRKRPACVNVTRRTAARGWINEGRGGISVLSVFLSLSLFLRSIGRPRAAEKLMLPDAVLCYALFSIDNPWI